MEVLEKIGVDYRDRKMISNLYMNQTASLMMDGELSDPAVIGRGVRQGGLLSTLLYNIYAEFMITETLENNSDRKKTKLISKQPGKVVKPFIDGYKIEQVSSLFIWDQ